MVTFTDIGPELNGLVGKPLPKTNYPRSYQYVEREVDAQTYELLSRRADECNYVLLVRKLDENVLSWRFVNKPPPQGCKFQSVRQLM